MKSKADLNQNYCNELALIDQYYSGLWYLKDIYSQLQYRNSSIWATELINNNFQKLNIPATVNFVNTITPPYNGAIEIRYDKVFVNLTQRYGINLKKIVYLEEVI